MADEPAGDGGQSGGSGQTDPPKQEPKKEPVKTPPVDDFKAKFEAAEAARLEAEKKLADALKGQMTDADRIAALEKRAQDYDTLNANFTALKSTYEAEQNEKKVALDQERAELVAKLKEARPGLTDANLTKCDITFLRDLAKNIVPPGPSSVDTKLKQFNDTRDKRIDELRKQRKENSKR